MAKIVIEIEDLPDGKVSYVPCGDLLMRDGGTPAQLTWIAVQDVIYMLGKIGAIRARKKAFIYYCVGAVWFSLSLILSFF